MRSGRCVTSELDVGCGADVMYIFDEQCSGKQSCDVLVGDRDMGERSNCNRDLLQYLEADYRCLRGTYGSPRPACRPHTLFTRGQSHVDAIEALHGCV